MSTKDLGKCYMCGYCCTRAPCAMGYWDYTNEQCAYLTKDKLCFIYNDIQRVEQGTKYPMFGSGCSSTLFNDVRNKKIMEMGD